MLATVTRADFENHVGAAFTLHLSGVTVPLELKDVLDRSRYHIEGISGRPPFTLVLLGPAEPVLPQGTYSVDLPCGRRLEDVLVTPMQQPHQPGKAPQPHYQINFG